MERNAEYFALKEELAHTPDELDFALTRAKARLKQRKRLRIITVPARVLLALAVLFTLLVNTSQNFALALSRVPVVSDMAAAVAFSPTLKMAVENGYMQYIGQEQAVNGITVRIEYVLVDEKQFNIFYTIRGEKGKSYDTDMRLGKWNGSRYDGFIPVSGGGRGENPEDIRRCTAEFGEQAPPNRFRLIVDATDSLIMGENPILATFTFNFTIDPEFVQKPKVYTLNQSFTLDGQSFTVTTVEVYPLSLRVNLEADPSNTKWIRALRCYAEDERRNRYELTGEYIAAEQSEDSPMMNGFRLESPYFGSGRGLTLYITGAAWLDKDAPQTKVDLKAGTAENLPDGVTLSRVLWEDGQCRLIFSVPDALKSGFRSRCADTAVFKREWRYSLADTDARREWFYRVMPAAPEEPTEEYTIKEEYTIVEEHINGQGYVFKREYTTVKMEMPSVLYLTPQYTSSSDAAKPIEMKIK